MSEDETTKQAREIAWARYSFRWHFAAYVIANAGLVGLWFYVGMGFPWPLFPIVFWLLGLGGHYFFAYRSIGEIKWVDRETEKIRKQLEKEKEKG